MQPYFFPYLGYFDLIRNTDRWIIFDTPQYIRHGWVNRNRILHPKSGWQYVVVPLNRHDHLAPITAIETNEAQPWRRRILGQLAHYRRAPYFDATIDFVRDCLATRESRLARLNGYLLDRVCQHLGIPFRREYFSEMALDIGPVEGPGDWALGIARSLGAREYLNPPGGESLFDRTAFAAAGIALTIRQPPDFAYGCRGYGFEPNLSIIDLLMWNRTEDIVAFLDRSALPAAIPGDRQ